MCMCVWGGGTRDAAYMMVGEDASEQTGRGGERGIQKSLVFHLTRRNVGSSHYKDTRPRTHERSHTRAHRPAATATVTVTATATATPTPTPVPTPTTPTSTSY